MPKVRAGMPFTWTDSVSPSVGSAPGAAPPATNVDFIAETGGLGNELRLPSFTASTQDRVYTVTQIFHDLVIPNSGNVTFRPHVHFTFNSNPAAGQTVIWETHFVYAKFTAKFQSTVFTLTAPTWTATAADEASDHIVLNFGDVIVPVADCGPSMIFVASVKLKSTSTISNNVVALLTSDFHYLGGSAGTDTEFS